MHQHRRPQHHKKRSRDHRFLGAGAGDQLEQRIEQVATCNQQRHDSAHGDRNIGDDRPAGMIRRRCQQRHQCQNRNDRQILKQQDRK